MQFNHIGISVTDLDRSIAFYRDMFGMEPLSEPLVFKGPQMDEIMDIPDVEGRLCMIGKDAMRLELFEFTHPVGKAKDSRYPVSDRGYSHFGIMVDDVAATYDRLKAAGVVIHGRLQTFAGGGITAAYCRDPDGNVFEIMQQP
jgi:catechol 2,3-dioxygenase-like lactoylglutathione lyase family enzyme